jgi:hypothetical protein
MFIQIYSHVFFEKSNLMFEYLGFDPSAVPDHAGVRAIRHYSAGSGYSRRGTRP